MSVKPFGLQYSFLRSTQAWMDARAGDVPTRRPAGIAADLERERRRYLEHNNQLDQQQRFGDWDYLESRVPALYL